MVTLISQQVRSIDRKLFFFKLKFERFRGWRQLWMKFTTIKQRYRMILFFVVFRVFVLLSNSISKLFTVDIHVRLLLVTLRLHSLMQTNNWVCFLAVSPLFCTPWYSPPKKYNKTIIRRRRSKHWWISTHVHFAFGAKIFKYSQKYSYIIWLVTDNLDKTLS